MKSLEQMWSIIVALFSCTQKNNYEKGRRGRQQVRRTSCTSHLAFLLSGDDDEFAEWLYKMTGGGGCGLLLMTPTKPFRFCRAIATKTNPAWTDIWERSLRWLLWTQRATPPFQRDIITIQLIVGCNVRLFNVNSKSWFGDTHYIKVIYFCLLRLFH